MPKNQREKNDDFWKGWEYGRAALEAELRTVSHGTQQQFYDLNPHDLDTIAMGIGLIVLHAADIQTISATMDTQLKLGLAEKVLGWLHVVCEPPHLGDGTISLRSNQPDSWVNPPGALTDIDIAEMFPDQRETTDPRGVLNTGGPDDLPF